MNGQTAKKHAKAIRITKKTLLSILIWAGGIIMVFPFLWMVSASFKGINEVFNFPIEWIPKNPTLKGYELLLKGDVPFITYFPVSYTHLDVYKRQVYERGEERNRNSVCAMTGFRHGAHAVFASIILPSEPATVP